MGCGAGKDAPAAKDDAHVDQKPAGTDAGRTRSTKEDAAPTSEPQPIPTEKTENSEQGGAAAASPAPEEPAPAQKEVRKSGAQANAAPAACDELDSPGPGASADASPKISPHHAARQSAAFNASVKKQSDAAPPAPPEFDTTGQDLSYQPMTQSEIAKISKWVDECQDAKLHWLPLPDLWGEVNQTAVQLLEEVEREKRARAQEREREREQRRREMERQESQAAEGKATESSGAGRDQAAAVQSSSLDPATAGDHSVSATNVSAAVDPSPNVSRIDGARESPQPPANADSAKPDDSGAAAND